MARVRLQGMARVGCDLTCNIVRSLGDALVDILDTELVSNPKIFGLEGEHRSSILTQPCYTPATSTQTTGPLPFRCRRPSIARRQASTVPSGSSKSPRWGKLLPSLATACMPSRDYSPTCVDLNVDRDPASRCVADPVMLRVMPVPRPPALGDSGCHGVFLVIRVGAERLWLQRV